MEYKKNFRGSEAYKTAGRLFKKAAAAVFIVSPAMLFLLWPADRLSAGFTINAGTVTFNNHAELKTSTMTINAGGALVAGSSKISVSGRK